MSYGHGSYGEQPYAASPGAGVTGTFLNPPSGEIVIAGGIPTISLIIGAVAASIIIAGEVPSVQQITLLEPSSGQVVITGQTPTITKQFAPNSGAVVIAGVAPTITKQLAPSSGQVVIAGQAPSITTQLAPSSGAVVINGEVPTVQQTGGALNPDSAEILIAGEVPSLTKVLVPTSAEIVIAGGSPTIALELSPGSADVIISGGVPTVEQPGGAVPAPARRFKAQVAFKPIPKAEPQPKIVELPESTPLPAFHHETGVLVGRLELSGASGASGKFESVGRIRVEIEGQNALRVSASSACQLDPSASAIGVLMGGAVALCAAQPKLAGLVRFDPWKDRPLDDDEAFSLINKVI